MEFTRRHDAGRLVDASDQDAADDGWGLPKAQLEEQWLQPSLLDDEIPLSDVTFCVIDLETTGMGPDAQIIEIGAIKTRKGVTLGEFQTLVNPGVSIPSFITNLTGISTAMTRQAPTIDQVFGSLVEFCRGCVMVAHNASFDMGFILSQASRLGYNWPSGTVVDTLRLARRTIPRHEIPNYQLGTLSAFFRVRHDPTHRSLDDVLATVDVLYGLIGMVGNQGVVTLEDLLEHTHAISKQRRSKKVWAQGLPEAPGVYLFIRNAERGREVLYVGTSKNIRRRVRTYFTSAETRSRMDEMIALATGVEAITCHTALEATIVEMRLITSHQPPYNRRLKQPHHTWIKLTDERVPRTSIVRKVADDKAVYCGPFSGKAPALDAAMAISAAYPLRPCTGRMSTTTPRVPCALAEMGSCAAPCTLEDLGSYLDLVEEARPCFTDDVRGVRCANLEQIQKLASQERFEEAGDVLARLRVYERTVKRGARLRSLSSCPQIVAARNLADSWEIHVVRYGMLAAAAVAHPGDDPLRIVDEVLPIAATIAPGVKGMPAGRIEEAELIGAWLEQPGVRLLDIDGTWGWPIHAG